MEADNIIAVNIPNLITITLLALVGGLILGFARKVYMDRMGG